MQRTVIPTENLTQRVTLPGHAMRDPWMTSNSDDPGKILAWFNASACSHKGKRWMIYRTECLRYFLWSRLSLCQLDENNVPIAGTNRVLSLHTRFDQWGAEDGRLFVFQDTLYAVYGDGFRVLLAQLSDNGAIVRCQAIPTDQKDLPPSQSFREKNWGFFQFDDRLFCQYSVCPTITRELHPRTWKFINEWESPWKWTSPFGTRLNGASPPVFHDGMLHRFVHTHRTERLPAPHRVWWSDKPQETAHRYYSFLATFEPEPPFAPVKASSAPLFHSEWEKEDGPTKYSVAYVGSSERKGDGWLLTLGENDCRIVTMEISDTEIAKKMAPVEPAKPRKIRRPARNHLHMIWMQGEEAMPDEDRARLIEWREMNPDWEVSAWDDRSLRPMVAEKAPAFAKAWQELSDLRQQRPGDVALTAKASDMARLILLSIRFSADQTWNAYADTDTRPYRPLTAFLNDDTLYGGNLGKQAAFHGPVSEKPWDSDDYDMLVTEENLQTPHRGHLTNAVMMARPGALAISAILKAGALARSRPTLQSWGPIMLRRSIEALKRTPDGRRIAILPFHYLVWNPAQMKQPPPSWSVCSHLNKFRWHQPGVRSANAGTGRGQMILV